MIIKFKNNLRQYFFHEIIKKEFDRLVNEEFKLPFDACDVKPALYISDSKARLWNNEIEKAFDDNEIIGKMKLRKLFIKDLNAGSSLMSAHYYYKEDYRDGETYFKLTEIYIDVDYDKLSSTILSNLENLELVKEMVLIAIRHEVGHLIDYISHEGYPLKRFLELKRENEAAKEAYYDKYYEKDGCPRKDISERERALHYYTDIPFEANANMMACVDVNRDIDIQELLDIPDDVDDVIELELNVISNKRVKREEKKTEKNDGKDSGQYE